MGGASIGDLPSDDERELDRLIALVAKKLREDSHKGSVAHNVNILESAKRWKGSWLGLEYDLFSTRTHPSRDRRFKFPLFDDKREKTGINGYVSEREAIGIQHKGHTVREITNAGLDDCMRSQWVYSLVRALGMQV